jgi:hypothetical protein
MDRKFNNNMNCHEVIATMSKNKTKKTFCPNNGTNKHGIGSTTYEFVQVKLQNFDFALVLTFVIDR